jgi:O-antigen/teichoic acid export membrane protein
MPRRRQYLDEIALKSRLIRASAGTFAMRIMQAAIGFANSVLIARMIGAEGVGLFSSTMAILALLVIPMELGTSRLAAREVARSIALDSPGRAQMFAAWARTAIVRAGIVVLAVCTAVLLLLPEAPDQMNLASIAIAVAPVSALAMLSAGILRGLKMAILGQCYEVSRNIVFFAGLFVILALDLGRSVETILFAQVAAVCMGGLAVSWAASHYLPRGAKMEDAAADRGAWRAALLPFSLIGGVYVVNASVDVLMIKSLSTATEAGIYHVTLQIGNLTMLGLTAINLTTMPYFSQFFANGDRASLAKLAIRTSQASAIFAALCLAAILLAGEVLMELFYGTAFVSAAGAMILISIGQLLNASTGNSVGLLSMAGRERMVLGILASGAILKIACNAVLIPSMGAMGAGWGVIVFSAWVNALFWIAAVRLEGINTFALAWRRP